MLLVEDSFGDIITSEIISSTRLALRWQPFSWEKNRVMPSESGPKSTLHI